MTLKLVRPVRMAPPPSKVMKTPARRAWLQDVEAGLVRVVTTHVTCYTGFDGDILYPYHPRGCKADAWLCEDEVRRLWRASRVGGRGYRIARLTDEGRRVLAEWSHD